MNVGMFRGNFPKIDKPETALEKRERYERWIVDTHHQLIQTERQKAADEVRWFDTRHIDPEFDAVMYQPQFRKEVSRPSVKAAIRARCWQCMFGDTDDGGTQRIKHCASTTCALWSVRPYQEGVQICQAEVEPVNCHDHGAKALLAPGNRTAAVKGYCHQCCGGRPDKVTLREAYTCPVGHCALWRVRPGANRANDEAQEAEADREAKTAETAAAEDQE